MACDIIPPVGNPEGPTLSSDAGRVAGAQRQALAAAPLNLRSCRVHGEYKPHVHQ